MKKLFFIAMLGFGLVLFTAHAEAGENDENAAICAEAQERLKDAQLDMPIDPNAVVVLTYKYRFCPQHLTVKPGTLVQWVNVDKRTSHSVWLEKAGIEESDRFFPGDGWKHIFDKAGEYPYMCGPHGIDNKMVGKVTVTE